MSNTGKWSGGKGSRPRPVDTKKFNQNWDRIFKKQDTKSTPSTSNDVTANVGC